MSKNIPALLNNPSSMVITLEANVQSSTSIFNGSKQMVELLGSHWIIEASWNILTNEQIKAYRAFIASLKGGVVPVYFSDISQPNPSGGVVDQVDVIGQVDLNTIEIACSTQPDTLLFAAGDYIQIKVEDGAPDEYKMVIEDVVSDAAGIAAISFEPHLRHAARIGDVLIYNYPKGSFTLAEPQMAWSMEAPVVSSGVSISLIELMV